jgi:hypothetical protein
VGSNCRADTLIRSVCTGDDDDRADMKRKMLPDSTRTCDCDRNYKATMKHHQVPVLSGYAGQPKKFPSFFIQHPDKKKQLDLPYGLQEKYF